LETLLGPEVRVEATGVNPSCQVIPRSSLPLSSRGMADSTIADRTTPKEAVPVTESSSSHWPPAQHVPLTIGSHLVGSSSEQNTKQSLGLDSRSQSQWSIVFPKGTTAEQAMSRLGTALAALQKKRATVVVNNLSAMTEIGYRLQELQTRFPGEMESLLIQWRENQSQLCNLLQTVQNVAVRQEPTVDPLLGELQATKANLLKRRQQLLMTHTAEHPETKQIESFLAEVEQEIQLRSRRQKDYSMNSDHGETHSPSLGHEATWLWMRNGTAIGTPPSSSVAAPNVNVNELSGERKNDAEFWHRIGALQSAIQTCDASLARNLDEVRAKLEQLRQRFDATQHDLQEAMADWELVSLCMPELDDQHVTIEITKRPTLWSFLLSVLTGILVYSAVVALMTGITESPCIRSTEQLSAITHGPVFDINLSNRERRFVDEANSISPPHYPTVTAEMGLNTNPRV